MSKLDMNNMESWGFDEYAQYFSKNCKVFGENDAFKNIEKMLNQIHKLQNKTVSESNVADMAKFSTDVQQLCESYKLNEDSKDPKKEWERFGVVQNLLKFSNENDYNQLRHPEILETHKGKKWSDLKTMPAAIVELDSMKDNVGANASERFMVEYNGKKGFFTPENIIISENKIMEQMIGDIEDPRQKQILNATKMYFSSVGQIAIEASQRGVGAYQQLKLDTYKQINSQDDKGSFNEIFWKHYQSMYDIRDVYQQKLTEKNTNNLEEKQKILDDTIKDKKFSENETENTRIKNLFLENKENLFEYADREVREITGEKAFMTQLDLTLIDLGKSGEKSCLTLLNDSKAKEEAIKIMKKVHASYLVQSNELGGLKVGAELSGRNTASTRIADKLGVGNLLARSQNMVIKVGDKEMKGCFMEFAEGIDMRNCKGEDLKRLSKVNLTNTPGFTKDMCNLEILDFICAQADRHAGNIFLKLDENNRPIGLQGIDNDMCLSDFSKNHKGEPIPMKQGQLKDLHFISEDMANKIQTITPDDLKCLVGDKIDSDELEALNGRVKEVQEHIKKNMFIVKDDKDWQLDGNMFEHLGKPEGLSDIEARRLFAKAWVELNDGLKMNNANPIHHNTSILKEIDRAKKRYEKESQKEEIQDKKEDLKKTEPKKEEPKPDSIEKTAEAVSEKERESKENEKTETQKEAPENDVKKEANSAKAIPPRPGFRRGVGVGAVIAGKTPEEIKELTKDFTVGRDGVIRKKDGLNPMGNHAETVPEKTTATVENLKEDGTEKIKTYEDGSKVKIVSSSDGQFIRSEGFRKRDDKRKAMNLTELVKSFSEQTKAVQRDADERKQQRDEAKKAAQIQNELDNPILDEMGYDRGFVKTKEQLQNPWSIMKNASRTTRAQMELADKKRNANEKKAEGKDSKFEDTRSKKDIAKNGGRQM